MSIHELPVMTLYEDEDGNVLGVVLVTAEGYRKFIDDMNIQSVALRVDMSERVFNQPCRTPLNSIYVPYITPKYKEYFIAESL